MVYSQGAGLELVKGKAKALYRGHKAQERAELWEGEQWRCSLSLAGSLRLAGRGEEPGIDEAQDGGKENPSRAKEVSMFCWDKGGVMRLPLLLH